MAVEKSRTLIRPVDGKVVLHPNSRRRLAVDGEPIALDPYWRRMIADGDVEMVPTGKPKAKTSKENASAASPPGTGKGATDKNE